MNADLQAPHDRMVSPQAPVLVYLVTEDWYFLSHRLPMALAAQQAGYQVHVATRVVKGGADIERFGFTLHPLAWRRGSTNPLGVMANIRQVRSLYRTLKPDLAHHVGLQPSIVGSLAAIGLPLAILNALTGLGFAFTSRNIKASVLRPFMSLVLRLLMKRGSACALVQNPDDKAALERLGVPDKKITLIPGSGVDTHTLKALPEPSGEVSVAFVGRLLDDKGLRPLVAAHELMRKQGQQVRLLIAGDPDAANPASIPAVEVERWRHLPSVEVLGHVDDIEGVWARSHIAVLPSRREGLPKSLLEAAAYGRPMVATDVPGCREIARHGVNAFLVPADDPGPLAGALTVLAQDSGLRHRLGSAGRQIVENEFSSARIGQEIVGLYGRLLADRPRAIAGPLSFRL
jgi:glycosyltransferase involved in cell wall biosynthesis